MQGNQMHPMGLGSGKIHPGGKAWFSALLEVPPPPQLLESLQERGGGGILSTQPAACP